MPSTVAASLSLYAPQALGVNVLGVLLKALPLVYAMLLEVLPMIDTHTIGACSASTRYF